MKSPERRAKEWKRWACNSVNNAQPPRLGRRRIRDKWVYTLSMCVLDSRMMGAEGWVYSHKLRSWITQDPKLAKKFIEFSADNEVAAQILLELFGLDKRAEVIHD